MKSLLRKYIRQVIKEGVGPLINVKFINKIMRYQIENNLFVTSWDQLPEPNQSQVRKINSKDRQFPNTGIYMYCDDASIQGIYDSLSEIERNWVDSQFTMESLGRFLRNLNIMISPKSYDQGVTGSYIVGANGIRIVNNAFGFFVKDNPNNWKELAGQWLANNFDKLANDSSFAHELQHYIQNSLYTGLHNNQSQVNYLPLSNKEKEFLSVYVKAKLGIDLNTVATDSLKPKNVDQSIQFYMMRPNQLVKLIEDIPYSFGHGSITKALLGMRPSFPILLLFMKYLPPELKQKVGTNKSFDRDTKQYIMENLNIKVQMFGIRSNNLVSKNIKQFHLDRQNSSPDNYIAFGKWRNAVTSFDVLDLGNSDTMPTSWGMMTVELDAEISGVMQEVIKTAFDPSLGEILIIQHLLKADYSKFEKQFISEIKAALKNSGIRASNISKNKEYFDKVKRTAEYIFESFIAYVDEHPPPSNLATVDLNDVNILEDIFIDDDELYSWVREFTNFVLQR